MKRIIFSVNLFLLSIALSVNADRGNKMEEIRKDTSEFNMNKFKAGFDFYATGNEPSWTLDLAINQFLRFNEMNGFAVNLGSVKGEKAMDANVTRYAEKTVEGFFSMTISQQECSDNMSGEKFDYKVIVEINNPGEAGYKKFEGCGKYVPNYKLNRTWILKKLGDKEVVDKDYSNGLPEISIDIEKNKFSGNGGCNRILGTVIYEADYLRFGHVALTKLKCPELELEEQFLGALEKVMSYKQIGNQLMLANQDELLLVLYDPTLEVLERTDSDAPDNYRLNDIWVLVNINGEDADVKNYRQGLPMLEFNIKEMNFQGNGGCNEINGSIEADDVKIKFGPIAATRMACPGNFESDFLTGLRIANTYKIENNRLYLMNDGNVIIIFKKVD